MATILETCRRWVRYQIGRAASEVWVPTYTRRTRFQYRERRIDEAVASVHPPAPPNRTG
jgi:hypothetical protein